MSTRIWSIALFAACSSSHPATGVDAPAIGDGGGGGDAASACPRVAPTGDHAHHVLISHPFDGSGDPSPAWEELALSATGVLTEPGTTFQMGVQTEGEVAFTPDGAIGIAPQDDGSLGVVRLAADGTPTVVDAAFTGSSGMYATGVVMAPEGDHAYVLDEQTRGNGGGVYRVNIGCDGTPTDAGLVVAATLPGGLVFVPGTDRALIAANDVGPAGSPGATATGNDAELLAWSATPSYLGGADAFGDDMAFVGGTALTSDGGAYLIGDVNQFETGGEGSNRLAVATRTGDVLAPAVVLPIDDPEALIASPFGDVVLSVSGFGNALYVLDTSGSGGAWTVRGQVAYTGAAPELPGGAVAIAIGSLNGMVLVAENEGVRRVELRANGTVVDDGRFTIGDGTGNDIAAIVGAIGVTP